MGKRIKCLPEIYKAGQFAMRLFLLVNQRLQQRYYLLCESLV